MLKKILKLFLRLTKIYMLFKSVLLLFRIKSVKLDIGKHHFIIFNSRQQIWQRMLGLVLLIYCQGWYFFYFTAYRLKIICRTDFYPRSWVCYIYLLFHSQHLKYVMQQGINYCCSLTYIHFQSVSMKDFLLR